MCYNKYFKLLICLILILNLYINGFNDIHNIQSNENELISKNSSRKLISFSDHSLNTRNEDLMLRSVDIAAVYTPYHITPGGGERYLLTSAYVFQKMGFVVHILVDINNKCQNINQLMVVSKFLRISLVPERTKLLSGYSYERLKPRKRIKVFFLLGNSKLPQTPGIGNDLNIYQCQFPFDLDRAPTESEIRDMTTYDIVLLNSAYTHDWYIHFTNDIYTNSRSAFKAMPTLAILNPPVIPFNNLLTKQSFDSDAFNVGVIGRWYPGRANKGQGTAIKLFISLINDRPELQGKINLYLIGNVHPNQESLDYVSGLQESCKNYPMIKFILNASPQLMSESLNRLDVLWHLLGTNGLEITDDPASREHFGIAIVEAMFSKIIPMALIGGGPSEIIQHNVSGFLCHTVSDFIMNTLYLIHSSSAVWENMRVAAFTKAQSYHMDHFIEKLTKITRRVAYASNLRNIVFSPLSLPLLASTFTVPREAENVAVIVESSLHNLFLFCVKNAIYYLNNEWSIEVHHSIVNEHYVKNQLRDVSGIKFVLHKELLNDIWSYNSLLKDVNFWKSFLPAKKILIFQTDSLFTRYGIEEYLKYDYVGSPWTLNNAILELENKKDRMFQNTVGNGGFSLRTLEYMITITESFVHESPRSEPEDYFFVKYLDILGLSIAPREEAYTFSIEVPCRDMTLYSAPLGLHASWFYFPPHEIQEYLLQAARPRVGPLKPKI
jgi:glycosyltransferase involved in cell wall biosynthesis